jgi:hypothetical protein
MFVPARNVSRLVGSQNELLVAVHHLCSAADHDPVLGVVVVHLQTKAPARLHLDALDLEALALLQNRVGGPGPVHRGVKHVRVPKP